MHLLLASFGEVMAMVGYVLLAILVLLIMITVHELGHYIVGKIFKFNIEEFAIGFGPKLFSKTKKDGEIFSIRLLPLGGFCAFGGEDEESSNPKDFNNKPPWQRILVLIAGAFMNYLFALLIIAIMFASYGQTAFLTYKLKENPEYNIEQSFVEKDVILSVNGRNIYLPTDIMQELQGKKEGDTANFYIKRQGSFKVVEISLKADANFSSVEDMKTLYDVLGIYYELDENQNIINGGLYSTRVRFGFFETIGRTFEYSFKLAGTIFTVLGQLLTGKLGVSAVGGTVTTISLTATAMKTGGFWYLLYISSFIGVNLAVFNLLPIPALDGSRVVFTLIEWIRKKPISRKVEGTIHLVGLVILFAFAIFADLQQCFL